MDYRALLNEEDFRLFSKLRDLRKKTADAEGIPLYGVFTNAQLAEMVRSRVAELSDFQKIEGVGKARVEKYGAPFLSLLREQPDRLPEDSGEE